MEPKLNKSHSPGVLLIWFLFVLLVNSSLIPIYSQSGTRNQPSKEIDSVLNLRGEAYIAIPLQKYKSAGDNTKDLILDFIRNDTAFVYLTAIDTSLLTQGDVSFTLLTAPSLKKPAIMASSIPEVLEGKAYPTYSQYLDIMNDFQLNFPDVLIIDTIGYSINNKLILAARIITGSALPEARPVVHLSSTMHGDEPLGYVLMLMLINQLMNEYPSSIDIQGLLNQVMLIINPLSNPDGTYFMSENSVTGSKRTNLNNVDLNRNFPDPYAGLFPYGTPRQPENQLMIDYLNIFPPSISANLHTGAEVVNYPWDWRENPNPADNTPNLHPDDNWFSFISKEYADTARNGHSDYMNSFPPWGISNGAAWYPVYGGRQDYVTSFLRGREITLEISDVKIPPASQIIYFYERNMKSLLNYIKQSTYGIHGVTIDEDSREPLAAKLSIEAYDNEFSFIFSDSITGAFHRYLKSGSYQLKFEKQNYISKVISLDVTDYNPVYLEVLLRKKENDTIPGILNCYPNPFINEFRVDFYSETQGDCKTELYNLTGSLIYSAIHSVHEGDNTLHISGIMPGVYILKISTKEAEMVRRVVGQ